ncbi:MAG: TM2 domain-containing protein [Bacteroidia bacterium]
MKSIYLILFFLFIHAHQAHAISLEKIEMTITDTIQPDSLQQEKKETHRKFPKKENKKVIAAVLAFPIPFGFLGLHRIYLGTEPWIPVIYLITAGGGMILPLIDFIAILAADKEQLKEYENNARLFMWLK